MLGGKLTVTKRDWGLAGISALLVAGAIHMSFGAAAYLFGFDTSKAQIFWLLGFGMWALAAGIIFYFMNDAYPKHRKSR